MILLMGVEGSGLIGDVKKEAISLIEEVTGAHRKYQGAPTFSYKVGDVTVDRNGNIRIPEGCEKAQEIYTVLMGNEFRIYDITLAPGEKDPRVPDVEVPDKIYESEPIPDVVEVPEQEVIPEEDSDDNLITIRIGKSDKTWTGEETMDKINKIMNSKDPLIDEALRTGGITYYDDGPASNSILFQFDAGTRTGLAGYAALLFSRICEYAARSKRITMKEKGQSENPRYQFRCFLLRLGFIGAEYKEARKFLLDGVPGNSAWLHPENHEKETQAKGGDVQ